jgi:pyruvate decarboxylase
MEDSYNDVQEWRYKDLLPAFGGSKDQYQTYRVETKQQVEELFLDSEFSSGDTQKLRFVELVMPWDDAPAALKSTAEAAAKRNAELSD